jgi:tRNA-modifying protein YgfZ
MPDAAVDSLRTSDAGDARQVDAAYAVLHEGALVVDRSTRSRWQFPGAHARETVSGLVTNDVVGLEPNQGCYAAALTPKGKIVADVRVFVGRDAVLVDTGPRAAPGWAEVVRKYVNPRVSRYENVSTSMTDIGVFGPLAARITGAALGMAVDALLALPPYGHREGTEGGSPIVVARVPDAGVEGFDVFGPAAVQPALMERLCGSGGTIGTASAIEITRIEAGRPEWGLDMDEGTIPQEVNFDELGGISYTKGCYTGQEIVARLHFRGHVNRYLRGLQLAAGAAEPPLHATLVDGGGSPVGDLRSTARSPRHGQIALAMIRREVVDGAQLVTRWEAVDGREAGEATGTVQALPFRDRGVTGSG